MLWMSGDSLRDRLVRPGQVRPRPARDAERRAGLVARSRSTRTATARRTRRAPASTTGSSRTTWTAASGRRGRATPRAHPCATTRRPTRTSVQPAGAGRRPARRRRRLQGHHLGRPGRQRPPGQVRPLQVRARPGATATSAPRAGRSTSSPGPAIDTGAGPGERDQRRLPLLPLGRPVQHARHGQGHGDPERHRLRLAAGLRPEDREVHDHPRPLPEEPLHARAWTGASTTPRPAGRAAGCGSTTASTRCCTPRSSRSYVGNVQLRPNPLAR